MDPASASVWVSICFTLLVVLVQVLFLLVPLPRF